MESQVKLAFLGDVTCDRPMIKAARVNGKFDFVRSLEGIKPVVSDCDAVIANLETVFAGEKWGYNPAPISYNSPDDLCEGIRSAGITFLTTANNHCLDMGGAGIDRTIETLERYGFEYTGTLKSGENKQRYIVRQFHGIKIAFVAMTDRLNNRADGTYHALSEWQQVNNLRARNTGEEENVIKKVIKKVLPAKPIKQCRASIKRLLRIPLIAMSIDNHPIADKDKTQIEKAIEILREAQIKADFVVACIHSGGQFNYEPGQHSKELFDALEPYCDVIIGNHPHVVQRMEIKKGKIRAYSLGGVNMSTTADYVNHQTDFDYSAIVKISLAKNKGMVEVTNVECEILHAEETDDHYVIVRRAKKDKTSEAVMRRLCNT